MRVWQGFFRSEKQEFVLNAGTGLVCLQEAYVAVALVPMGESGHPEHKAICSLSNSEIQAFIE